MRLRPNIISLTDFNMAVRVKFLSGSSSELFTILYVQNTCPAGKGQIKLKAD